MLWLCLYFPNLPLEIFTRSSWEAAPLAVSIDQSHRQQVLIGNAAARSRGVHSGMSISAAYAVAGDLRVLPHNEAAEAAALEHLASWSTQFTSLVNLYPPQGLLLEIAGSLRFFGGLPLLLRHIRQGLKELGYEVRHAIAPTPLGAVLLARSGQSVEITDLAVMRTRLAAISLTLMDFPPKVLTSLRGLGTRTLGDCLCLPRDGLSRRFGPELLTYFDQMLGNIPDLRKPFIPPPCFESRLILPSEVDNTEALLFALRRLLLELTGFLIARDAGVQQLEIILAHRKSAATRLQLDLITPSRDLNH